VSIGDDFSGFRVLSVVSAREQFPEAVVLEKRYARWGAIAFVASSKTREAAPPPRVYRKPVGCIECMVQPYYHLDSDYYTTVTTDANDYITRGMLDLEGKRSDDSWQSGSFDDREPSFANALRWLTPVRDYVLIGRPEVWTKWVVAPDGRIKHANDSMYTSANVSAPPAGTIAFDPRDFINTADPRSVRGDASSQSAQRAWPVLNFSAVKSGLVGGHLPIANMAAFLRTETDTVGAGSDGEGAVGNGWGFELVAVGSGSRTASGDRSELLVRMAIVETRVGTGMQVNTTEHAFCLRVDSQDGNNSAPVKPAPCDCRLVFEALLDADDYWNTNFFAPGSMQVHGTPFHERRHFDSVKGTIASTALDFQGLSPNYGTGWDYWSYGPGAVRNYKNWKGQRALPLQSLALDGALAEWGMLGQARARVEFYFTNFFHPDGSFKMDDWGCNRDMNAWTRKNNVMNDGKPSNNASSALSMI
jgi:hypothetical protein